MAMACNLEELLALIRQLLCTSSIFDIHREKAVWIDAIYTESQYPCFEERKKSKENDLVLVYGLKKKRKTKERTKQNRDHEMNGDRSCAHTLSFYVLKR